MEFSEFANRPPFSFLPAPLLPAPPTAPRRPPPRWVAPSQVRLRLRFTWRPRKLLDPLSPRAGASTPRHATPTSPGGRHRDAAVARPTQRLGPRILARSRTTSTPESFSPRSFAFSPLPELRTPASSSPPSNRASTAAPLERRRAQARRRTARPQPLRPC